MKAQRSLGVQVVVLAGMLVTCITVAASPQVLLEPLSQDLSVSPPGFVTLVFRITNTGAGPDTFDLYATIPDGWTTLALSEWVQVLGDEKLTTALLDRLAHRAHILTTKGLPYESAKEGGLTMRHPILERESWRRM